jgi:hypothetical protein
MSAYRCAVKLSRQHAGGAAAQALQLGQVPVRVYPGKDEDDILALLVESNNQRAKNYEQIGHEYNALFGLEK